MSDFNTSMSHSQSYYTPDDLPKYKEALGSNAPTSLQFIQQHCTQTKPMYCRSVLNLRNEVDEVKFWHSHSSG